MYFSWLLSQLKSQLKTSNSLSVIQPRRRVHKLIWLCERQANKLPRWLVVVLCLSQMLEPWCQILGIVAIFSAHKLDMCSTNIFLVLYLHACWIGCKIYSSIHSTICCCIVETHVNNWPVQSNSMLVSTSFWSPPKSHERILNFAETSKNRTKNTSNTRATTTRATIHHDCHYFFYCPSFLVLQLSWTNGKIVQSQLKNHVITREAASITSLLRIFWILEDLSPSF